VRRGVLTGHVEKREMVACLQSPTLYVSRRSPTAPRPPARAEAMACAPAGSSTDVGNVRRDDPRWPGRNVVPVKTPLAAAERILDLLDHPEQRGPSGSRNRRFVEEHINVDSVMKQVASRTPVCEDAAGKRS